MMLKSILTSDVSNRNNTIQLHDIILGVEKIDIDSSYYYDQGANGEVIQHSKQTNLRGTNADSNADVADSSTSAKQEVHVLGVSVEQEQEYPHFIVKLQGSASGSDVIISHDTFERRLRDAAAYNYGQQVQERERKLQQQKETSKRRSHDGTYQ